MNLFDDLESYAKLDLDNDNCKTLLNFCFSIVIQQELQNFVEQWNNHRIRPSRDTICAAGKPNELYYLPENFGKRNMVVQVENEKVQDLLNMSSSPPIHLENEFFTRLRNYVEENGMNEPNNRSEATELYLTLWDRLIRI